MPPSPWRAVSGTRLTPRHVGPANLEAVGSVKRGATQIVWSGLVFNHAAILYSQDRLPTGRPAGPEAADFRFWVLRRNWHLPSVADGIVDLRLRKMSKDNARGPRSLSVPNLHFDPSIDALCIPKNQQSSDCLALVPTKGASQLGSVQPSYQICTVTDDVRQGRYRTEFR